MIKKISVPIFIFLCVSVSLRLMTPAQVRPIYDRGATGLGQMLKRLNTTASALMIGAHPDDEDTALLTYLARGESARTAYLSLTRGDGGQNIIGPELGEALGVIRTEELLQARRLDGAEQYFTRAYDYGFSKTLEEAKSKWDEKVVLCDVVRVIRSFRPLVVISQFSGTSADGHGQHQYAGYISPLAVKAAADPSQCTDAGSPWTVKKFYVRHGFRATGEPQLKINTGKYDPLLGRSYFEIAMEARSQHKSQEQGVLELKGDQFSGLNLIESKVPKVEKEASVFDGLSTSIANIDDILGTANRATESDLIRAAELAEKAKTEFRPESTHDTITNLVNGLQAVRIAAEDKNRKPDSVFLLTKKIVEYSNALRIALGIEIDALVDKETVVPGNSVVLGIKVYFPQSPKLRITSMEVNAPTGWKGAKIDAPKENSTAFMRREIANDNIYFNVTVPLEEKATQPYWFSSPREGDLYRLPNPEHIALPFEPQALTAVIYAEVDRIHFVIEQPVQFRYADDIRGEIRRNVEVVPKVTLEMDQSMMIVPYSEKEQTRQVVMTVTNHSQKPVTGTASLNFDGAREWKYTAESKIFELKRTGEKSAITVDVTIPARTKAGSYRISGQAMIGEDVANITMKTIAYPHIQTHRYYRPAAVDVKVMDLKTTRSKVGYIVGSGDRVPEAIRQMGIDLEMVSERELASGNLSRFDVIVVGIRAYQVRPDIVANNQRLLDYARDGGTLIVQYQLPSYAQQNMMPFPAQMGPRVADENATVTILQPEHPIFNFPNKITDADFAGWVQERNLYNFSTMDAAYTPLLESHDAGEAENKGGLVIAKFGKGNYIYCNYSMFRQLPAGVPGAYRLFANLLMQEPAR
ncbi:MAG: PIG-L family deacetylase [Chloracidobacterium sp.]|nr:PIG-L family deacetylase [Chloracidobacterium sp.]